MKLWCRLLLRLYPKQFRRRYGAEVLMTAEADLRSARFAGRGGALRFFLLTCGDVVASASRQRARQGEGILKRLTGGGAPAFPNNKRGRRWTRSCRTSGTRFVSSPADLGSPRSPSSPLRSRSAATRRFMA